MTGEAIIPALLAAALAAVAGLIVLSRWLFAGTKNAESKARLAEHEATELRNEKEVRETPAEEVHEELVDAGVFKPPALNGTPVGLPVIVRKPPRKRG